MSADKIKVIVSTLTMNRISFLLILIMGFLTPVAISMLQYFIMQILVLKQRNTQSHYQ
jgi:hypothetical protein